MPPVALAEAIKRVCQKTRGLEMNQQQWFNEYWLFMAKDLLDAVSAKYADFPVRQLSWAAQTKSDWEGYLWHWAVRKMLEPAKYSDLVGPTSPSGQDAVSLVAKARIGLATVRAIAKYGLLMHDLDRVKLGRTIWPTMDHVANCVQLAYGNPAYDPATIEIPETHRSKLMVEVFDNYFKQGHNWLWERSRNWSYLARVTTNLPPIKCDSCGHVVTRDHQTWRCPRCGKRLEAKLPGLDWVEPYVCPICGRHDHGYQTGGIRCPACETAPNGKYVVRRDWLTPTFARRQEGLRNAQHVHAMLEIAYSTAFPTQADRAAFEAWKKVSPKPGNIPPIHTMELETHDWRLNKAAVPNSHKRD